MALDKTLCKSTCRTYGNKTGHLTLDYGMCAFNYVCSCCLEFNPRLCKETCSSQGQIPDVSATDDHGCSACKCKWDENNYTTKSLEQNRGRPKKSFERSFGKSTVSSINY